MISRMTRRCRNVTVLLTTIAGCVLAPCGCDDGAKGTSPIVDTVPARKQYSDGSVLKTWMEDGVVRYSLQKPGAEEPILRGGGWNDYHNWHIYYDVETKNVWNKSEIGLSVRYPRQDGTYGLYVYDIYGQGEVLPHGVPRSAPDEFVDRLSDRVKRELKNAMGRTSDETQGSGTP